MNGHTDFKSTMFINLILFAKDDLLQAIARAKEILVAKVDQNSSVDHASLTNEVDNSVKKALSMCLLMSYLTYI